MLRAAWNNFTGGQTQGGSTITQQYARLAFDLQGATYSRKMREAILAWKLDDQLSKEKILEYYLNAVPFGRNTYGVEAAARRSSARRPTGTQGRPADHQGRRDGAGINGQAAGAGSGRSQGASGL